MNYDLDYFINKFEAIPKSDWCIREFNNELDQKCALGHCGTSIEDGITPEAMALMDLCKVRIDSINDGFPGTHKYGYNPKTRVVNYLKELKNV